ncbi:MAG: VIT domain-containing protein [Thermoanaerobaculum sp.]|nr:VIT domain-containing protein [Thermoanaerobaculum sp.]
MSQTSANLPFSATQPAFVPVQQATGKPLELTLQELALSGVIMPVGARLVVRHLFRNRERAPVEALYTFALPRDGALRRFRVLAENFSVESELKPRASAREEYEKALGEGHLAGLAEQYADGLVTLALGNLRPNETVVVFLEMLAGVDLADEHLRFRFPFTLAPRYVRDATVQSLGPGMATMELPQDFGDVILPTWVKEAKGLHAVSFDLQVAAGQWGEKITSPSHPIEVEKLGDGMRRIFLQKGLAVPNADLVLEARGKSKSFFFLGGVKEDRRGHFALVLPSTWFGKPESRQPLRVVFVLDCSGSMSGVNWEATHKACARVLGGLKPEDSFSVVVFNQGACALSEALLPATVENVEQARQFLASVEPGGGTEIISGLRAAAELAGEGAYVFLVTDGQVGGTDWIVQEARRVGLRLFCLGIGSASEDRFLALLSEQTGGRSLFLTAHEKVEAKAEAFFKSMRGLVAKDLQIEGKQVVIEPKPAPEIFAHGPAVIFGETTEGSEVQLVISWTAGAQRIQRELTIALQDDRALAESVALFRGAKLLSELDARWGIDGTPAERREQRHVERAMQTVSEKYGLASRVMSLVAVLRRPGDRPGEPPKVRVVPVGMPQDTLFEAYFLSTNSGEAICFGKTDVDPSDLVLSFCEPEPSFFNEDTWKLQQEREAGNFLKALQIGMVSLDLIFKEGDEALRFWAAFYLFVGLVYLSMFRNCGSEVDAIIDKIFIFLKSSSQIKQDERAARAVETAEKVYNASSKDIEAMQLQYLVSFSGMIRAFRSPGYLEYAAKLGRQMLSLLTGLEDPAVGWTSSDSGGAS